MFSISKNPQANMAEVLAKAEKYINGEEALMSKKESSSTSKDKKTTEKRQGRAQRGKATKGNLRGRSRSDPLKGEGTLGTAWAHHSLKGDDAIRLSASLL